MAISSKRGRNAKVEVASGAPAALPEDLNQLLRAYQESRAMLTALELDIFTAVGGGATGDKVAGKISTHPRATEMLLNALVAMGMLTKQEGVFRNTPRTARYFVEGSKDNARPGLLHLANIWHRWSTLTDCVRVGTCTDRQEPAERADTWTESFIAAMHRIAAERAPMVVAAVGTDGVKRLLDVGGGSGAYSIAFAKASESLRATVLDLANVLPITGRHIQEAGLASHIEVRPGDLRHDQLGRGFDLVLVSAICHMLSPEENQDLLRRCFEALASEGRLAIQDFILEPDKTAPRHAALFALNMLVGTEAGSTYSDKEYSAWMGAAGFKDIRHIRLQGPSSLMVGRRAAQ